MIWDGTLMTLQTTLSATNFKTATHTDINAKLTSHDTSIATLTTFQGSITNANL